jgi:uncharacterized protein YndB with AHSA1/START domain
MRYVLIAIGVLAGIVLVIAIVGWSLPVRHQASAERTYRASPTALFALITDVSAFPSWRSEVTRVEQIPDENGHRRWIETTRNGPPITYSVEQMVPDRLLVGRIADTGLPFGGSWTYELEPRGSGTTSLRITENGEVYNPIFRFVSRYVMGHDATIKQYLAAVEKRFPPAEAGSAAR